VERWHHASRDVAVGVYLTAGGIGSKATIALNPISWCLGTECEVAFEGRAESAMLAMRVAADWGDVSATFGLA
jgi:hypothetical protein